MLVSRWFVFLSHLELLGQAEAQFEPMNLNLNLLLMGMELQLRANCSACSRVTAETGGRGASKGTQIGQESITGPIMSKPKPPN